MRFQEHISDNASLDLSISFRWYQGFQEHISDNASLDLSISFRWN